MYEPSHVQTITCTNYHRYELSHVQTIKCTNHHMYEPSHVRTITCTNYHMYELSHVRNITIALFAGEEITNIFEDSTLLRITRILPASTLTRTQHTHITMPAGSQEKCLNLFNATIRMYIATIILYSFGR